MNFFPQYKSPVGYTSVPFALGGTDRSFFHFRVSFLTGEMANTRITGSWMKRSRFLASRMVRSPFVITLVVWCNLAAAHSRPDQPELNDVHFHLTTIQEGTDIHDFLKIISTRLGASLAESSSTGMVLPEFGRLCASLLSSDRAPLYYYFSRAYIAMAYRSLSRGRGASIPLSLGFPADMYATFVVCFRLFPACSGIGSSITRSLYRLRWRRNCQSTKPGA